MISKDFSQSYAVISSYLLFQYFFTWIPISCLFRFLVNIQLYTRDCAIRVTAILEFNESVVTALVQHPAPMLPAL